MKYSANSIRSTTNHPFPSNCKELQYSPTAATMVYRINTPQAGKRLLSRWMSPYRRMAIYNKPTNQVAKFSKY